MRQLRPQCQQVDGLAPLPRPARGGCPAPARRGPPPHGRASPQRARRPLPRAARQHRRRAAVRTPAGRTLEVVEAGAPDGPVVVKHHGTPGSGRFYRSEVESAEERGLRLVTYSRPGYGGSTAHTGRDIASAASDVTAILDGLRVERFATYGWAGRG